MAGLLHEPVSKRVMNLAVFADQVARRFPARAALVWGDRQWTWTEFTVRVDALANAFSAKGLGKGDRILLIARNSNAMLECMFAILKIGAVLVPVNFRLLPTDIAYIAKASGAAAVVYDDGFTPHAEAARQMQPDIHLGVTIGATKSGDISYEDFLKPYIGEVFSAAAVEYDDACWFFFTSGTTGHPKAAILTHGQMAFVITNHIADLMPAITEQSSSLVVAPLSHGAGIHQLVQIARGAATILTTSDGLDPNEVFALVEKHSVGNIFTVPSIVKRLVESGAADNYDHSSLQYVVYAGAPMYRADQQRAIEVLGKKLVQYFGLGEVTGAITVLPPHLHDADDEAQGHIGSCGFARTGMQIEIQGEDGKPVPDGETGEICVIGPAVFSGYYANEEANQQAFRNGWFRTGDIGHLDTEGFLYITGRRSDMFISGGSNIYPREIEEKLLTHPDIGDVAVVGMPDEKWGEVGVAAIVLKDGCVTSAEAIISWMDGRIARYKQPRLFEFFSELPKSGYGKVTKNLVREAIQARKGSELQKVAQ